MPNSFSPVLDPHTGRQENPGATAFFNNTLYYIGNGHNSGIWALSRRIEKGSEIFLNPGENPDIERTYWQQAYLDNQKNFQHPVRYYAGTDVQPSAVVAGGYLYFIWVQKDATNLQPTYSVWAIRLAPGGSGQTMEWSQPVCLCEGDPLMIELSNFTVMAWGNHLVGCFSHGSVAKFLVFDTSQFPAFSSSGNPSQWQATASWSADFSTWPNFPQGRLGSQVSMDWFTTAGTPPEASQPAIYYIVSFFNEDTKDAYVFHAMNVQTFDQWWKGQPFETWKIEHWTDVTLGVQIIRDPAGRMRAYHGLADHSIGYRVLPTNVVSLDGYCWSLFGAPSGLYGEVTPVSQAAVPAFVIGPGSQETVNVEIGGKEVPRDATVCQVYEFVMFGGSGIRLRFSHFGKAVEIADAYQLPLDTVVPAGEQKLIVTGVIDSPLPMPAANVASRPTPYSRQTQATVAYGTTKTTGDTRRTDWSATFGLISSGKSTKGVGPAWNISFAAGPSGATGSTTATQNATEEVARTDVDEMQKILRPTGTLFAASVIYHRSKYTFYDLSLDGGTFTVAKDAPAMTSVWIEYAGADVKSFAAYANTVGNIWSYTRNGWNARMRALGYKGDNYFKDVIALQDKTGKYVNAVMLNPPGSADPFLGFSWSSGGDIINDFNTVSTHFTESGWSLKASAYGGISWGAGVSVFGIGENATGELLVGGSYSRSTVAETNSGSGWGIDVNYRLQDPPAALYPGDITSFSWNLWMLAASEQWAEELIAYGPPQSEPIDPGSRPWRIVFEVIPESVTVQGDDRNLVYRAQNGDVIEAWYHPANAYSYGRSSEVQEEGNWSWTDLTEAATPFAGTKGKLPNAAGDPFWFAWGMNQPGYLAYTQLVLFRSETGNIYLLAGTRWPVDSASPAPPGNTQWRWLDLAQTPGFAEAAGDPVSYRWDDGASASQVHVIYRGADGDLHDLWASAVDRPQWQHDSLTGSLPHAQKPASDASALVGEGNPGGVPSQHVFYRGNDGNIYELRCDSRELQWKLTDLSAATGDKATPEGQPHAFVWNASLHVGYRGSTGEIHEFRRQANAWQPADDPSWDAHATAPDQRAAKSPICGYAWERHDAPQTIHWFYLTDAGAVCELFRFEGTVNAWGWNDLGKEATDTRASGRLPPVSAILQGYAWDFDPLLGSSVQLYLRTKAGSIFELRFLPDRRASKDGSWRWTELTGWVTDAQDRPLPNAVG